MLSVEGLRRIFSYRWSPDRGCYDPGSHRRTTSDSYHPPTERWGPTWSERSWRRDTPEEGFERDGVSRDHSSRVIEEVTPARKVHTEVLQPIPPVDSGNFSHLITFSFYLSTDEIKIGSDMTESNG